MRTNRTTARFSTIEVGKHRLLSKGGGGGRRKTLRVWLDEPHTVKYEVLAHGLHAAVAVVNECHGDRRNAGINTSFFPG